MENTIIGMSCNSDLIELFIRSSEGYKFRIPIYQNGTGYGPAKDMYMCSPVTRMTNEQYKALPDRIIEDVKASNEGELNIDEEEKNGGYWYEDEMGNQAHTFDYEQSIGE